MIVINKEQVKRVIIMHLEKGYTAKDLSNMSLISDTKYVAYLLGVTCGRRNKLDIWKEILKVF